MLRPINRSCVNYAGREDLLRYCDYASSLLTDARVPSSNSFGIMIEYLTKIMCYIILRHFAKTLKLTFNLYVISLYIYSIKNIKA